MGGFHRGDSEAAEGLQTGVCEFGGLRFLAKSRSTPRRRKEDFSVGRFGSFPGRRALRFAVVAVYRDLLPRSNGVG